ncbi:MAG: glycosyltransferase family 2 protein [Gammaproteobacteria bacterium]
MNQPLVTAVMPCLNEERTLATCIQKAQQCFRELGVAGEVVVADNGSADRSVEIAEQLGARVVHQHIRGYGAALMKGIEEARGEIVVMADADDSYDWLAMGPFIAKIREGFDLVMGNRFAGGIERGAMPPLHRYFGNPILSAIARIIHRAPVGDFHCGMRAFTKSGYRRMQLRTSGMEFATEMVVNAVRSGLRVTEVPTKLRPDGRDRPPHLRSFRDGWRHLRFIFTYAPNYLYLAPGAMLSLLGLVLVAALARGPITLGGQYFGIHFLALGCALTITGFNVIHLGIIAKLIAGAQIAQPDSKIIRFALNVFTLEGGLVVGAIMFLAGFGIDAAILWKWLTYNRGSLADTVHIAFVATLLIVLGLNIVFSSFLLSMIAADQRSRMSGRAEAPAARDSSDMNPASRVRPA